MSVELLERASLLADLDSALASVEPGGRAVLVAGEAGIGKSALVREFARRHEPDVRVLIGLCDPLLTPRALGPWHDIARQIESGFAEQLTAGTHREEAFGRFLDELARHRRPRVVVVEDVHWADEATLDLLVFLSRRLERMPVLFVVTYRDDELATGHPLHTTLGGLPPERLTVLRPGRLSEAAVARLARQTGRSAGRLHTVTGGNPLLVTEMLAADTRGVPRKVADLVLARLATLDASVQEVVRFIAAAGRLRSRLRSRGTVRVPRGPRPATAGNPGKLTARQLEVLALLGGRLTNADIAMKLSLSVRTVDHHVAAILAKLDVSSRREAVIAARRLGITLGENDSRENLSIEPTR